MQGKSVTETGIEMAEKISGSAVEAKNSALNAISQGRSIVRENVIGSTHLKTELSKIIKAPKKAGESLMDNSKRLLRGDVIGILGDAGDKLAKTLGTPSRLGVAGAADSARVVWEGLKLPVTLPLAGISLMKKGTNMMLSGYGRLEDALSVEKPPAEPETETAPAMPEPAKPVGEASDNVTEMPQKSDDLEGLSSNEFAQEKGEGQGSPTDMAA